MSQDLRSIVSILISFLDNLLNSFNLADKARETVLMIIAQVNIIQSMVNDVTDLNLIEKAKFVPKLEPFKPRNAFDFIVAMFKPQQELMNNKI